MARKTFRGAAPIIHDDIGFEMERLFDKHNMDHIPAKKRLDGFAHRNLPHVKHYKAAVNIFGGPLSRKRVIIAPPMETPLKRKLGMYWNERPQPQAPAMNSELKPPGPLRKMLSSSEIMEEEEKEKEVSYKKWYQDRLGLRGDLDGMGLSEQLLQRKADKTELEKRVETKLRAARLWKPESPPPPSPEPEEKEPPVVPNVKVPVPTALQTLDRFLTEKKIRLIDLFRNADTNKDWKLNKHELLAAVKKYEIPLTAADVEDLMVTLDHNFDEELDFKEVSQGLAALKMERRANRRQGNTPPSKPTRANTNTNSNTYAAFTTSSSSGGARSSSSPPQTSKVGSRESNSNQNRNESETEDQQKGVDSQDKGPEEYTAGELGEVDTKKQKANRVKSAGKEAKPANSTGSRSSSAHQSPSDSTQPSRSGSAAAAQSRNSTPNSLELPPLDTRDESRVASSAEEMLELRKHDKTVLERARQKKWPWPQQRGTHQEMPGVIRIGHKEVDEHCMESTLEGEVGDLMNQFRRSCLKEYFHAIRLCQEKGIILTPELLDKVLLYPPEIPTTVLVQKFSLPKGPLAGLDESFARPPKKPKTPPEIRHKDKMKRSANGSLMIDARHMYPPASRVAAVATKENLSTGRALVARKSDVWMTFEEYDKYTSEWSTFRAGATDSVMDLENKLAKLNAQLPIEKGGTYSKSGRQTPTGLGDRPKAIGQSRVGSIVSAMARSDKGTEDGRGQSRVGSIVSAMARSDKGTEDGRHLPRRYKKLDAPSRSQSGTRDATQASSSITGYTSSQSFFSSSSRRLPRYKGYHLDEEKFWPGYMLDKLAMYEPGPNCPAPWSQGGKAIFHGTQQARPRANLGKDKVLGPPINQDGRILKYGIGW